MGAYARSPAGALLRQWKYEGVDEARTFLLGAVRTHVSDMRERYAAFVEGAVLVPAPCDPIRRATRGFDQSVMLAREVSRALGGPRVAPLLARSVRFKAQASLDGHDARRRNARDAFLIKKGIVVPDRVVLIDDVATSGATLEACAVVLKKAGVLRVRALTIMRG
jgi:ComF family protein